MSCFCLLPVICIYHKIIWESLRPIPCRRFDVLSTSHVDFCEIYIFMWKIWNNGKEMMFWIISKTQGIRPFELDNRLNIEYTVYSGCIAKAWLMPFSDLIGATCILTITLTYNINAKFPEFQFLLLQLLSFCGILCASDQVSDTREDWNRGRTWGPSFFICKHKGDIWQNHFLHTSNN